MKKINNMWNFLENYSNNFPDKIVYTDYSHHTEITSSALADDVIKFASQLASLGISENDKCIIIIKQNLDFPRAFFACSYLGAIPVPLNFPKKNRDITKWEAITEDTKAVCVITDSESEKHIKNIFSDSEILSALPIYCRDTEYIYPMAKKGCCDIAFLQYTSGSTGLPKGVIVGNSCVSTNMEMMCRQLSVDKTSNIGMWLPYYHDMGLISGFLLSVYTQAHLVFMNPIDFMMSPIKWAEIISRYGITHTPGPNFAFEMLAERLEKIHQKNSDTSEYNLSSLKCAFCGSEPVNLKTIIRFIQIAVKFGMDISSMKAGYGLAENSLFSAGYNVYDKEDKNSWVCLSRKMLAEDKIEITDSGTINDLSHFPDFEKNDSIFFVASGHDIPEHKITIRDDDGNIINENNKIGNIYISGNSVAYGYYGKNELSKRLFRTENGLRTFNTGDVGFFSGNNELIITGRKKEMLIINGKNYYPTDIEHIIDGLDGAFENNGCAGFTYRKNDSDYLGIAVEINRKALKNPQYSEWERKIRFAVLSECGLKINTIAFLKPHSISRTTSGKLQRAYLGKMCEDNSWEGLLYSSSLENTEKNITINTKSDCLTLIKNIIRKNTGLELYTSEYNTPFTELGITSVMCLSISSEIEKKAGVAFTPQMFYTYCTIKLVAEYIWEEHTKKSEIKKEEYADIINQLKSEIGGI